MEAYIVNYSVKEDDFEMESQIVKGCWDKKNAFDYVREESLKLITKDGFYISSGSIAMEKDFIELSTPETEDDEPVLKVTYTVEYVLIEGELPQKKEPDRSV